jgi:glycosyltransferase involved in cell wall biosynthesis
VKAPDISIIISALNEAESIGHVVAEMPWAQIAECIVVDNGSTDTAEAAVEAVNLCYNW